VPARRSAAVAPAAAPVARARLDVDERKRQLLALGAELFGSRTYDEVSIDEVARTAGISKGLLYYYFPTKRDFYVATVRVAATRLLDLTKTPPQMGQLDRFRAGLDAFFDYVTEHGPAYENLLRSGIGTDAEVTSILDETREAFCARLVMNLEIQSDLTRLALRGWVGFVEATALGWLSARDRVPRDAVRDMLVSTALHVLSFR
jgi:AcrR family transcriptional regulator